MPILLERMKIEKVEKLVANLPDKTEYVIRRSSLPEVFCRKVVLRNFVKFTGKHLCQKNFAKFLRTPFLTEHLRRLLLYTYSKFKTSIIDMNTDLRKKSKKMILKKILLSR